MLLDWSPLWLALRYAGLSTSAATLIALPLAWLLAHRRFAGRQLLDALANLPLVLPPAVTLYYLSSRPRFDWRIALALSVVYTLPLPLRMLRDGFDGVGVGFENAARSLGASEWRVFWRITLPLTWRVLLAAVLAGFARAYVDFSLTLVSIPMLLPVAIVALAALYAGNRLRPARVAA